jgi:hypothetical protein
MTLNAAALGCSVQDPGSGKGHRDTGVSCDHESWAANFRGPTKFGVIKQMELGDPVERLPVTCARGFSMWPGARPRPPGTKS